MDTIQNLICRDSELFGDDWDIVVLLSLGSGILGCRARRTPALLLGRLLVPLFGRNIAHDAIASALFCPRTQVKGIMPIGVNSAERIVADVRVQVEALGIV
jgi:hypothetical protein